MYEYHRIHSNAWSQYPQSNAQKWKPCCSQSKNNQNYWQQLQQSHAWFQQVTTVAVNIQSTQVLGMRVSICLSLISFPSKKQQQQQTTRWDDLITDSNWKNSSNRMNHRREVNLIILLRSNYLGALIPTILFFPETFLVVQNGLSWYSSRSLSRHLEMFS